MFDSKRVRGFISIKMNTKVERKGVGRLLLVIGAEIDQRSSIIVNKPGCAARPQRDAAARAGDRRQWRFPSARLLLPACDPRALARRGDRPHIMTFAPSTDHETA